MKQMLFILITAEDDGIPVQFRIADGNTNDSIAHIETSTTLKSVAGRSDFRHPTDDIRQRDSTAERRLSRRKM